MKTSSIPNLVLVADSPRLKHVKYDDLLEAVEQLFDTPSRTLNQRVFRHLWCEHIDPTITNFNYSTIYWNEFYEKARWNQIKLSAEEKQYVETIQKIFIKNIPEVHLEWGLRIYHEW